MFKRCSIPQRTGFAVKNADIVPGIVDNIITTKLPGMVGNQYTIADYLYTIRTCTDGGCLAGKFAINAIVVPVISNQAGAGYTAFRLRITLEPRIERDQACAFFLKHFPYCSCSICRMASLPADTDALVMQPVVQFRKALKTWPRNK